MLSYILYCIVYILVLRAYVVHMLYITVYCVSNCKQKRAGEEELRLDDPSVPPPTHPSLSRYREDG